VSFHCQGTLVLALDAPSSTKALNNIYPKPKQNRAKVSPRSCYAWHRYEKGGFEDVVEFTLKGGAR